jgi:hypothetical protein
MGLAGVEADGSKTRKLLGRAGTGGARSFAEEDAWERDSSL